MAAYRTPTDANGWGDTTSDWNLTVTRLPRTRRARRLAPTDDAWASIDDDRRDQ